MKLKYLLTYPLSISILIISIFIGYLQTIYPEKRVLTWFEIATDGHAPDDLANIGQLLLKEMWIDGFNRNVINKNNLLTIAICDHLNKQKSNSILELASGGGGGSTLLIKAVRNIDKCKNTKLIMSDQQPPLNDLDNIVSEHKEYASYIPYSVDAINIYKSLNDIKQKTNNNINLKNKLRMIFASFHHFNPELAQNIIKDVIKSNSSILIGDLVPNKGVVLYNWLLLHKYVPHFIKKYGLRKVNPILQILGPFIGTHDATISALRAQSYDEIKKFVTKQDFENKQETKRIFSESIGKWLNVPKFAYKILPGINDKVMQFIFIYPKY